MGNQLYRVVPLTEAVLSKEPELALALAPTIARTHMSVASSTRVPVAQLLLPAADKLTGTTVLSGLTHGNTGWRWSVSA
jgi:hypothetical protein